MKYIGFIMIAVACLLAARGLVIVHDDSEASRIVGGDAYNYIISATRGTAWVCSGIVAAVAGLAFVVAGALREVRSA